MAESNNKRIAKNTVFLYGRMLLVMLVTLYTSRVTLKVLGVDDYGIYQTVGGVVTFLSFLSNALGTGTSRFLTFEMGKKKPRLSLLFATVRTAHIVLGLIIVVLGEIIGLWFIYNKLVIPADRLNAAVFAFHFSIIATFFQITQIPYNATLIAHEDMNIYAYISIVEAVFKLAIVFLLQLFVFDLLEFYAALMCTTTVVILFIYRIYCRKKYPEVKGNLRFDRELFKGVASFSGWNLITSSAMSLANQGVTIVTNMFFEPSVVTIRSLALRVNDIINTFIGNFRTAVNPQIVKKYAAKDYEASKKLALESTKYTYYLMLIIVVPILLLSEPLLKIWLDEVPDGLVPFVQIAVFQGLFQALDTSLYAPIFATGKIKENALISPLFDFIQLPIVYGLFLLGYPPIVLAWVSAAACILLGVVVKPILVHKIVNYGYMEIKKVIGKCMAVTLLSSILPVVTAFMFDNMTVKGFIVILAASLLSTGSVIWFAGLDKSARKMIRVLVSEKFMKKRA